MGQVQRRDFEIADGKSSLDQFWLGNEITFGPRAIVKGVSKHAPEIVHCCLVRINRQRISAARIAKTAAIVQAHDMVRM